MEDEDLEKTVLAYLKRKGYKQTELALQEEQNRISSSSSSSLSGPARSKNGAARYHDGYSKLRSWAYSSLDLYKHELLRVLYPVFIHCFMDLVAEGHMQEAHTFFNTFHEDRELMHLRDLQKLEGILSRSHLEYSYDLLLQYLQTTPALTMLGIINEHINFEALVGSSQEIAKLISQKEVHWGLLEDSIEERLERALSDSEKAEGENKDVDVDDNTFCRRSRTRSQISSSTPRRTSVITSRTSSRRATAFPPLPFLLPKRSADGGKQSASPKKLKKDKLVGAMGKNVRSETTTISMALRVMPELTLPAH